ncbi:MAG: hypothetical protein ACRENU_05100 [Gemmatimonadaceae bacterium]
MQSRLVIRVVSSWCLVGAASAGAQTASVPTAESVAIIGCRREAANEVRKARLNADTVFFTPYPQVFPRPPYQVDVADVGQYFDRVQRLWIAFSYGCAYNYQSSVARVFVTWSR